MKKHFYMGIRIDKITNVCPSGDHEFPTEYQIEGGRIELTNGDWRSNVRAIENILNGVDISQDDINALCALSQSKRPMTAKERKALARVVEQL